MSRNLVSTIPWVSGDTVARLDEVELPRDANTSSARVSFTLEAASLLFVVGQCGSGKSKIFDLLSFQTLPSSGSVWLLGVDPARLSPSELPRMRRRVGVLFQDQRLLSGLDVFGNVAFAARAIERRAQHYTGQVDELLAWVGLRGRQADPISSLTAGERRRLCLARALINQPDLLLADEPTAALDANAQRGILRLIAEVNSAGTAVVIATRSRELALNSSGSVYELPSCELP